MGHYELSEAADVYTQLMFSDYDSTAQIAPGGAFGESGTVNCDNPLMSAQQLAAIGCDIGCRPDDGDATNGNNAQVPFYILRRNVEGGGRQDTFRTDSFRGVLGVRGAITENWSYDASAQYSKVKVENFTLNRFVLPRFLNALDAVDSGLADGDPLTGASGEVVCRSGDAGCVPYNLFTIGAVEPGSDVLNYLQVPSLEIGNIEQEIYGASVTGDLGGIGLASPLANDSIKVVFGVEITDGPSEHDTRCESPVRAADGPGRRNHQPRWPCQGGRHLHGIQGPTPERSAVRADAVARWCVSLLRLRHLVDRHV